MGLSLAALNIVSAAMAGDDPPPIVTKAPASQATPYVPPGLAPADAAAHVEAYSGLDIASHGWIYGWLEGTVAPFTNNDTSGLRVRLYGEVGEDTYSAFNGGSNRETGTYGDFLVGYAYVRENFDVGLYLGAAAVNYTLASPDPTNPVQGTAFGAKVEGEFQQILARTLLSGEAFYTTAFKTYEAKLKFGPQIVNNIYLGPEVIALGDARHDQWRVGAHVTAVNIGNMTLAVSGGYASDNNTGPGAYTTIQAGIEF